MHEDTPVSLAALLHAPGHEIMSLDHCIIAWLHAKSNRSESRKTASAYTDTLADFRATLQQAGHDLDSAPHLVVVIAQGWAGHSKRSDRVTPGTYNQRLSILSSFYHYAITHAVLSTNPIERVERRVARKEQAATPIAAATVKSGLAAIDRRTLEGKRDYALLSIALATGRRVGELAGLRYGHIQHIDTTAVVQWVRCKGNKQMTDTLPPNTTRALSEYLVALYGVQLGTLSASAPIWVSFSNHNRGLAIGPRTIQRICELYLQTSKVHATRHTWAVTMHRNGATLADIGRGLGHSNLKTTSDYLEQHLGYENPLAATLEKEFGI